MVVGRDYMLKKADGPSASKLFLDTKLVPAAVNVLGGAEVALDRASARTGVRASMILAGVAGVVLVGAFRSLNRRRPAEAPPVAAEPYRAG